jgi:hypothetical protein
MSHIKLNNKIFLCNYLFMTSTNKSTTTARRKKRLLTSSRDTLIVNSKIPIIQNNPLTKPQQKKKRKRVLNQPFITAAISSSPQQPTPSPPTITTPKPTDSITPITKRSIRASSEAIAKREKERQDAPLSPSPPPPPPPPLTATEDKQPIIKRKRKLNSQKVVIPTNDSSPDALVFEETGDVSYAKYLDSPSTKQIPKDKKPTIVIGMPTKKRRLVRVPAPTAVAAIITTTPTTKPTNKVKSSVSTATTPTEDQQVLESPERALDLSQHSILPNSSYIAHLPVSQQQKKREKSTTTTSSSEEGSIMYTMDNYITVSDKSSSPPSIFFDAISDFEEMTLNSQTHSEQEEEMELFGSTQVIEEIVIKQEQSATASFSFWNSILKPFTRD